MENNSILLTVLGFTLVSAIVSGIITMLHSQRIKRVEFNYDYRKFILDRRKEAYLQLEKSFRNVIRIYDGGLEKEDVSIERLKLRQKELIRCREEFSHCSDYAVWYSNKILNEFYEHDKTFKKYQDDLDSITIKEYSPDEFAELQQNISLREWAINIKLTNLFFEEFLKDLMSLDNVNKFMKEHKTKKIQKS